MILLFCLGPLQSTKPQVKNNNFGELVRNRAKLIVQNRPKLMLKAQKQQDYTHKVSSSLQL